MQVDDTTAAAVALWPQVHVHRAKHLALHPSAGLIQIKRESDPAGHPIAWRKLLGLCCLPDQQTQPQQPELQCSEGWQCHLLHFCMKPQPAVKLMFLNALLARNFSRLMGSYAVRKIMGNQCGFPFPWSGYCSCQERRLLLYEIVGLTPDFQRNAPHWTLKIRI